MSSPIVVIPPQPQQSIGEIVIPPSPPRINLIGVAQLLKSTFSLQRKKKEATLALPIEVVPLGLRTAASSTPPPTAKLVVNLYNSTSVNPISTYEQPVTSAGETAWEELSIGFTTSQQVRVEAYVISTDSRDTWFDELKVEITDKPTAVVVQENAYYPFGQSMKGIDYTAPSPNTENKFTFNGQTEKETKLNLNWHETAFRGYDPQLGRFHQIDPLADLFTGISGYQFGYNNPILFNDPTGLASAPASGNPNGVGWISVDPLTAMSMLEQYDKGKGKKQENNNSQNQNNNPTSRTNNDTNPSECCPDKDSNNDDEIPFLESMIPIWGSGKQAYYDFQQGRYVWGSINTAIAISDVFLVGSIAKGVAKGGFFLGKRGLSKSPFHWDYMRAWYGRKYNIPVGQERIPVHHWFISRNEKNWLSGIEGRKIPDWFKNQPWNLLVIEQRGNLSRIAVHQAIEGKGTHGWFYHTRLYYGTPQWSKTFLGSYILGRPANNLKGVF